MKRVAVLQSNYVPWKGYFDLLASVDEFILYDQTQFSRGDWRNRNRIKTMHGLSWITVPVQTRGHFGQAIRDVRISDPGWQAHHWKMIEMNYQKSSRFTEASDLLKGLYLNSHFSSLSTLNRRFIEEISSYLGINTFLTSDSDYLLTAVDRNDRLVELCKAAGASVYVSGPRARNYLDESKFHAAGLEVEWYSYGPYNEYQQLFGPFVHEVSILDLLFNCGTDSTKYMRMGQK